MDAGSGSVVSNTTPLIVLADLGLLEVLPGLYGAIMIPETVLAEYSAGGQERPRLEMADWLTVVAVEPAPSLTIALDAGEAAAIALALACRARLVLLAERCGRRIAQQHGLTIAGSLGVLLAAKHASLIPAVRPFVDTMLEQGRYVGPLLYQQILAVAGEIEAS
jgi:hypothetical protein